MGRLLGALLVVVAAGGCLVFDPTGPDDPALAISSMSMVERGDTVRLAVTTTAGCPDFCYEPVREATWSVAPQSLASIAPQPLGLTGWGEKPTASALLTGIAPGTVTVRATVGKNHGDTEIRVYPILESLSLTPAGGTLRVGDTVVVTSLLRFENDTPLPDQPFYVWRHVPESGTGFVADATLIDNGAGGVRVIARAPGTLVVSAGFLRKSAHAYFRVNAR